MKGFQPNMLKELRKSRGFTQEQLGVLSGMTKSQISKMENGTLGSEETVLRLLSAMGYSLEYTVKDNYSGDSDDRSRVLDILRSFKKYNAERFGIESMALFGSVSRGEHHAQSDVDILISLKDPSLYLFAEISDMLQSVLKRDVDLISANAGHRPEFRTEIEGDLIYV